MKAILTTAIFLTGFGVFGQTKTFKVKKIISQDQMTSVVTLGGLYYGSISPKKILADSKFRISNNKGNLRIVSFEITFGAKGDIKFYAVLSDSLTPQLIQELNRRDLKTHNKVFITAIKAVNTGKDTVFMNPIELKLIMD